MGVSDPPSLEFELKLDPPPSELELEVLLIGKMILAESRPIAYLVSSLSGSYTGQSADLEPQQHMYAQLH